MENEEYNKQAEERRRKIIANAEGRLKKITDLAKMENTPQPSQTTAENEFVDFEVDSFVNENTSSSKIPAEFQNLDCFGVISTPIFPKSTNDSAHSASSSSERTTLSSSPARAIVHESNGIPNHQLPNEMNRIHFQNWRNANPGSPPSQNPADFGKFLDAFFASASSQMPSPQSATAPTSQEDIHPALKPALNIAVFLILGFITRIFFQFSTLKINVFAPFLCLAIPIAIMSWGRWRRPISGLLSVAMMFIHTPWIKSLILNWIHLTRLLRGLSRLFACYFFSFVTTHAIFELSTIHEDITEYSSPVN